MHICNVELSTVLVGEKIKLEMDCRCSSVKAAFVEKKTQSFFFVAGPVNNNKYIFSYRSLSLARSLSSCWCWRSRIELRAKGKINNVDCMLTSIRWSLCKSFVPVKPNTSRWLHKYIDYTISLHRYHPTQTHTHTFSLCALRRQRRRAVIKVYM